MSGKARLRRHLDAIELLQGGRVVLSAMSFCMEQGNEVGYAPAGGERRAQTCTEAGYLSQSGTGSLVAWCEGLC